MYIIFPQNGSRIIKKIYFICFDELFDAGSEFDNNVIFALMHLCPIKGSVFSVKSEQLEVCRLAVQLCGMEHRFGGDAAAVQTGAADIPAFNQSGG